MLHHFHIWIIWVHSNTRKNRFKGCLQNADYIRVLTSKQSTDQHDSRTSNLFVSNFKSNYRILSLTSVCCMFLSLLRNLLLHQHQRLIDIVLYTRQNGNTFSQNMILSSKSLEPSKAASLGLRMKHRIYEVLYKEYHLSHYISIM